MKKLFTLLLPGLLAAGAASAQTAEFKAPKRHYINLAYATQQLKFDPFTIGDYTTEPVSVKSDQAFAAEFGTTYFFNGKKPIAGMVRIGLDWSYLDVQYASFKADEADAHFVNIGMQVGPSVTVTPVQNLHLKAYVHYAPSAAAFSPEGFDNIKFGYAGYVTGGVQASYRFITLGVEMRAGWSKMNMVTVDPESVIEGGTIYDKDVKVKTKLPSTRFIVGFRF